MSDKFRVSVIADFAAARPLADTWSALHQQTPGATPWQGWEWFESWWNHMHGNAALCLVLVADQDDQPRLLLPLQRRIDRIMGLSVRVLEPVGMPDEINRPRLALGEYSPDALKAALDTLQYRGDIPGWDMLRLDEVTEEDPAAAQLEASGGWLRLGLHRTPLHPCPYLDLRQDWDTFLAGRGRKLGRNLKAAAKRLEAVGPISLTVLKRTEDIETGFDTLLDVHSRSWKQQAGIGLASGRNYVAYYRRFLVAKAAQGRARLLLLRAGEHPVAAAIGVTDEEDYYGAQIVHDARFDHCSPGTLLESLELEALMRERRFRHYDFFGAAMNNKRRWTDSSRSTERWLLFRATPAAQLIRAYYFGLKPSIKRLRPFLPARARSLTDQ